MDGGRSRSDDKSAVREACPATADWINQVVAVFGRPAAIEVRDREGRVIYRAGCFDDDPPKGCNGGFLS